MADLIDYINQKDEILGGVLNRAKFWTKNSEVVFHERQKKVLNRFMDNFEWKLTSLKWAKICNCSQDSATKDINDLIDKKILKKVGNGRNTHYVLSK